MPCTPDILLLASDLGPFAKAVHLPGLIQGPHGEAARPFGTTFVCVNPGRLSKFSFAHLKVAPGGSLLKGPTAGFSGRCRVEIRRV
jgi:hypothetical protein